MLRAREEGTAVPPRATGDPTSTSSPAARPVSPRAPARARIPGRSRRSAHVDAPPRAGDAPGDRGGDPHRGSSRPTGGCRSPRCCARAAPHVARVDRHARSGGACSSTRSCIARSTASRTGSAPRGTSWRSCGDRPASTGTGWPGGSGHVRAARVAGCRPRCCRASSGLAAAAGFPAARRRATRSSGALETVAARRLFRVAESVEDLDPISRNAAPLPPARLRRCPAPATSARCAAGPCARPGADAGSGQTRRDPAPRGLRQAWRHFQQYRRAVARAAADED